MVLTPANLPAALTTFVGRAREIREIAQAIEQSRLLTLVGPAGCGKSRLAVEAARAVADRFGDGVWWVDLAPVGDGAMLSHVVAAALGVRDQPRGRLTTGLARFLTTREILLVLDNCEHVIGAAAELIQATLKFARRVRALATSREPLRIDGEHVLLVPPLSYPESRDNPRGDRALEYEAITLFADRAGTASAPLPMSDDNSREVIDICRRVDGMPLAIELAAARARRLPVGQIAASLQECFDEIASDPSSDVPRHQTVLTAIDWSYDLLTGEEQQLLRRLAVFVGDFTLDAAVSVTALTDSQGEMRDRITRLIEASLVFATERDQAGESAYRLLETVRQYAHEKLLATGDAPGVLMRHVEYYLWFAEDTASRMNTSDRQACLVSLEREYSNLRAALERASRSGERSDAARIATALFWFWFHRGRWREGRTLLGAAIHHEASLTWTRARALLGDGVLAWAEGDQATAKMRLEECAAIGRTLSDKPTTAHALHFLALVRLAAEDASGARPLAKEAVRLARTSDDSFSLTLSLASYGVVLVVLDELDAARVALEESVERGREAADGWALALRCGTSPSSPSAEVSGRRPDRCSRKACAACGASTRNRLCPRASRRWPRS